jgi:hypothetical protein
MDRVPALGLVDPDDHQPTAGTRAPYHPILLPVGEINLDSMRIAENLVDLLRRDPSLGMVLSEVSPVGIVPCDWPVVHTSRIDSSLRARDGRLVVTVEPIRAPYRLSHRGPRGSNKVLRIPAPSATCVNREL